MVGVLEVECPGEIDVTIEVFEVLLRQVGPAIDDVRTAPQNLIELRLVDCGQDATELEQDPTLKAFGQPRHESKGGFAADQTEITDHPGPAALGNAPHGR